MLNLEKRTNGTEEELPVHRPPPAVVDRQQYEQWISDEFTVIYRELSRLAATKRQKGQPVIYLATPGEVLEALKQDVIDKAEARKFFGLARKRMTAAQKKLTATRIATLAKARAARKPRAKR